MSAFATRAEGAESVTVEWVRLLLDVSTFDDAPFEPYLTRCRDAGLTFTTIAELGDTTTHRRLLYELNKTCSADIPDRGTFYTFDEYVTERLDVGTYDPSGVILALDQTSWVGMTATSLHRADGYAFSAMTGVLAAYRGIGLSISLKLLAIRFVRRSKLPRLRTFHHPDNTSAIAMNRRLGFVEEPRS